MGCGQQGSSTRYIAAPAYAGEIDSQFGTGFLSDGPGNYPDNTRCTWYLMAPPGSVVYVRVTEINIEHSSGCSYDKLKVRHAPAALIAACDPLAHIHATRHPFTIVADAVKEWIFHLFR